MWASSSLAFPKKRRNLIKNFDLEFAYQLLFIIQRSTFTFFILHFTFSPPRHRRGGASGMIFFYISTSSSKIFFNQINQGSTLSANSSPDLPTLPLLPGTLPLSS